MRLVRRLWVLWVVLALLEGITGHLGWYEPRLSRFFVFSIVFLVHLSWWALDVGKNRHFPTKRQRALKRNSEKDNVVLLGQKLANIARMYGVPFLIEGAEINRFNGSVIFHIRPLPVPTKSGITPPDVQKLNRQLYNIAVMNSLDPGALALNVSGKGLRLQVSGVFDAQDVIRLADLLKEPLPVGQAVLGISTDKWLPVRLVFGSSGDAVRHIQIGGETGSGKSHALRDIVLSLLFEHAPDEIGFIALDRKGSELSFLTRLPHTLAYATGGKGLDEVLLAERIMIARQEALSKGKPLVPLHLFLVVDEALSLDDDSLEVLERLLPVARAPQVHVIYCTQISRNEDIPPAIRENIGTRIALRSTGLRAKDNLLGKGALMDPATLQGRGDAILRHGSEEERVQCAYCPLEDVNIFLPKTAEPLKLGQDVKGEDLNIDPKFWRAWKRVLADWSLETLDIPTVREILGIARSTAYVYLQAWEEAGLLEKQSRGRWRIRRT